MTDGFSQVGAGVRKVKSAAHTIEVLEYLSARQNRPARLQEISEALSIPKSSCYALVRTLTHYGWVQRDEAGVLYSVGIRSLMAGTSYVDADPSLRYVQPWLDALNEQLDETIHFGRLDGTDIVYLATRESSQYLRAINRVGRRLPASATSLGKAILSEMSEESATAHVSSPIRSLTQHTITDVGSLARDLVATRERGFAIDLEENTTGLKCFGFALRYSHPIIDAISCSVPLARLTEQREAEIVDVMRHAAAGIEHRSLAGSGFPATF